MVPSLLALLLEEVGKHFLSKGLLQIDGQVSGVLREGATRWVETLSGSGRNQTESGSGMSRRGAGEVGLWFRYLLLVVVVQGLVQNESGTRSDRHHVGFEPIIMEQ